MKIVAVAPVFWPATIYGGPVYTMTALVKALAARGEEITVLTGNLGNSGKVDAQIGTPVDFYGARLLYLNQRRTPPYGPLEELEIFLEHEARDADILHISSTLTRSSFQAMRWATRHHIPYAVTTRGHLIPRDWRKDVKKRVAVKLLLERYLRGAVFLQATSMFEAGALASYGFRNVKILPHGIELPEQLPERSTARAAWGLDDEDRALIALGRIHPVKGLELLIKAAGQIARQGLSPVLLIAGTGPQAYVDQLRALAAQENIATRCRFVGQVDSEKKWSLLRAGDVFVHLSTGESFGLAIGEALGADIPVLIGEHCGWDDVTELGFGQRVPLVLDAVVAALSKGLSDFEGFNGFENKPSVWIRTHYTWRRIADEMVSLYRRALEN